MGVALPAAGTEVVQRPGICYIERRPGICYIVQRTTVRDSLHRALRERSEPESEEKRI